MTTRTTTSVASGRCSASRRWRTIRLALLPLAAVTAGCGADPFAAAGGEGPSGVPIFGVDLPAPYTGS